MPNDDISKIMRRPHREILFTELNTGYGPHKWSKIPIDGGYLVERIDGMTGAVAICFLPIKTESIS